MFADVPTIALQCSCEKLAAHQGNDHMRGPTFSTEALSAWSSTSSAICVVLESSAVMQGGVGGRPPPVASRPTPYVVTALSSTYR